MKKELSLSLKTQKILSSISLIIGILLLILMIKVESEPGALPLLLMAVGIVWLSINQLRIKKQNN